tara:strand:+ start:168 stop:335 length:168 start_codon:yes stop_codon:yes gene_type:complete
MFTKLLKKLFSKPEKDEHLAFYEDIPEPEIKVFKCNVHIRFKKSCPTCLQAQGYA